MKDVYIITRGFPAEEKFGLVSQINRAAISVASNLAEGSGRIGRKDQAHFTQLSYGSLMELACQLEISNDLGFIEDETLQRANTQIQMIAEKLSKLRTAQISGPRSTRKKEVES